MAQETWSGQVVDYVKDFNDDKKIGGIELDSGEKIYFSSYHRKDQNDVPFPYGSDWCRDCLNNVTPQRIPEINSIVTVVGYIPNTGKGKYVNDIKITGVGTPKPKAYSGRGTRAGGWSSGSRGGGFSRNDIIRMTRAAMAPIALEAIKFSQTQAKGKDILATDVASFAIELANIIMDGTMPEEHASASVSESTGGSQSSGYSPSNPSPLIQQAMALGAVSGNRAPVGVEQFIAEWRELGLPNEALKEVFMTDENVTRQHIQQAASNGTDLALILDELKSWGSKHSQDSQDAL